MTAPPHEVSLRIIVWNCAQALHRKYDLLLELQPDIAVVPECAEPEVLLRKAPGFAFSDCCWTGGNRNKGLAVFAFGKLEIEPRPEHDPGLCHFLPVEVHGPVRANLLAVWAFNHRQPAGSPKRATTSKAIERYSPFLRGATPIVAGDFNANVIWDSMTGVERFSSVDAQLRGLGLVSAYHQLTGEGLGQESQSTLMFRKNRAMPYHIDYVYAPPGTLRGLTVGDPESWLPASDHMPLVAEMMLS